MKHPNIIRTGERFIQRRKLFVFILVMCLTIALTRAVVVVYDPDLFIFGFEIHHFDYGIALLILSAFLLLFDKKQYPIYLLLAAVATGLIIDQLWYIRSGIIHSGADSHAAYQTTFSSAIIAFLMCAVCAGAIYYFRLKHK